MIQPIHFQEEHQRPNEWSGELRTVSQSSLTCEKWWWVRRSWSSSDSLLHWRWWWWWWARDPRFEEIHTSYDEPMVRRLREENEDAAIIIDSLADAVWLLWVWQTMGKEIWSSAQRPSYKMRRGTVSPPKCWKSRAWSWWTRSTSQRECNLRFKWCISPYFAMEDWRNVVGESIAGSTRWRMVTWRCHLTWKIALTVQGRMRIIRDEDESSLEVQVPEALEKESMSVDC